VVHKKEFAGNIAHFWSLLVPKAQNFSTELVQKLQKQLNSRDPLIHLGFKAAQW